MAASFDDLLKELSPIVPGDHVTEAASSSRMNAIMTLIRMLAAGENIMEGPNLRKDGSSGKVILTADTSTRAGSGGGLFQHPFRVYKSSDNSVPPYPILKVRPGILGLLIPKLANELLSKRDDEAGAHPWFYSPTGDYSLFLKAEIDTSAAQINNRAGIVSVKVVADEPGTDMNEDLRDPITGEFRELYMRWDGAEDPPTRSTTKGYFLLKIADIHAVTEAGNIVVKDIVQYLFVNYQTFVITNSEVIALA